MYTTFKSKFTFLEFFFSPESYPSFFRGLEPSYFKLDFYLV